jgi:hypothetical protein
VDGALFLERSRILRKIKLLAALLAMACVLLIGASGPAMAQYPWDYPYDDYPMAQYPWDYPYDDHPYDDYGPYDYWRGSDDVTGVDWEYDSGYSWYPEEVAWVHDGYVYEVEYAPCDDDLCPEDFDRDSLS